MDCYCEVVLCVWSTTACDRGKLNECLTGRYVFAYVQVEFVKFNTWELSLSFGEALANRDPKLASKRILDLLFLILASDSRGA
jgi:hypothetical protein